MAINKKSNTSRAMRLECLRIAANVVGQLKDTKISVVDTAKAFYAFVEGPAEDEVDVDDDDYPTESTSPPAFGNGRYSMRDLRKGR